MTDNSAKTMCLRIVAKRKKFADYKVNCLVRYYVGHCTKKHGRVLVSAHIEFCVQQVIKRAAKLGITLPYCKVLDLVLRCAGRHGISTVR